MNPALEHATESAFDTRTLTRAEYAALRRGYREARRQDQLDLRDPYRNRRQIVYSDRAFSYFQRHPLELAQTFLRRMIDRPVAGDRCRVAVNRLWARRARAERDRDRAAVIAAAMSQSRAVGALVARERAA